MNKLKALTEDKYTLNDVFVKNHQIWLALPLFIYMFTPVVHMIVYAICYNPVIDEAHIPHMLSTGEMPGDYFSEIIHLAFLLGTFVTVIATISWLSYHKGKNNKISIDDIPLCFFVIYVALILISTVLNKTPVEYIMGYTVRSEGVTSLICYYLVYYLCSSKVSSVRIKYVISYLFLIIGLTIGVLSIINKYAVDIPIIGDGDISGIFYTTNFYAYYLSISIMLAAALTVIQEKLLFKIITALIFALDTFVLAVNDSLGGFLACVVAFIFMIVIISIKNKKISILSIILFAFFLLIIFVTGLFTPSFFSEIVKLGNDVGEIVTGSENAGDAGTARWTLWTHTAQYMKEKPWIGWGFEGTADRLGTETHTDKAHNEYLENMAYFGIPAGLIYIIALMSVYLKAMTRLKKMDDITICCLVAALGYIGSALVGNSFIFTAPYMLIFLGLANSTCKDEKVKTPEIVTDDNISEAEENVDCSVEDVPMVTETE